MTMVVGMFETLVSAQRAVADLVGSGYARNAISVLIRDGGTRAHGDDEDSDQGPLARATSSLATTGVIAGGALAAALHSDAHDSTEHAVMHTLANAGLKPAAATFFADAICNGAILVAVHCPECEVRDARDILDIYTEEEVPRVTLRHTGAASRRAR